MNSPHEEASPGRADASSDDSRPLRNLSELQKTITMAQIARAAGVSQGAISSLLNDRDYGIRVSEKTRERVFKVCRDMGYIPNDLRAVVRMYPELGEYCILLSSSIKGGLSDPFVARLVQGAMRAIADPSHPITLAIYRDEADYLADPDALPHPIRSGVASKFLSFGPPNISILQHILRRNVPAVVLGSECTTNGILSLLPDYSGASRIALEHLFTLNHRHIGIVSGPFGSTDSQTLELHRGIKLAYDRAGIPIDAQNVVYGDLSYKSGSDALDQLFNPAGKPTAIFCLSDAAASGVVGRAHELGLRVPGDLSVIGCGNDPCSETMTPRLTTVHIPAEEMAETGIHEIEAMIRLGADVPPQRRVVPVRLVERASTAPRVVASLV